MDKALERIMLKAGQLMTDWQQPKVYEKGRHADYVTEADFAVQTFLMEELAKVWPEAKFYAEEKKDNRLTDEMTFIIDPIDGTTNYVRQRSCSMISVGAVQGREAIFGAILDPYKGLLYHAEKGRGAFCGDERLHVADVPFEQAIIGLGTSPYDTELVSLTARSLGALLASCGDIRRTGSAAMELCDIAAGRSDGTFEWILQPWDYCAGSLLVSEAGGRCGNILGGGVTFDQAIPLMAASDRIYDALQAVLVQLR